MAGRSQSTRAISDTWGRALGAFLLSTCRRGGRRLSTAEAIRKRKHRAGEVALAGVSPAPLTTRSLLMVLVIIPQNFCWNYLLTVELRTEATHGQSPDTRGVSVHFFCSTAWRLSTLATGRAGHLQPR
jgi:hypothetical protein